MQHVYLEILKKKYNYHQLYLAFYKNYKNKIYVRELNYEPLDLLALAFKLDRLGITEDSLIIADSAEPRLIDDLKHSGINIEPVKKGTIESGIIRMQDYQIIVDESSNNITKEFNNYVYLNKASKLYIDNWNHIIDAIRYNVIYNLDNPNKGKYSIY